MANKKTYQVSPDQLTVGANIILKGKVDFSNIAKPITGQELIKKNEQRMRNGLSAIPADAYTSLSIYDAQVQPRDPNQMSIEEFYINERLYRPKAEGRAKVREGEPFYTVINRGMRLPNTAWINKETNRATPIKLPHELAKGVEVILILNVFKAKSTPNGRGIGIDEVFIVGEPQYYIPGVNTVNNEILNQLGITMDTEVLTPEPEPTETQSSVVNTEIRDGYAMPAMNASSTPEVVPSPTTNTITTSTQTEPTIEELKAKLAAAEAAAMQANQVQNAPQATPVTPPAPSPQASAFTDEPIDDSEDLGSEDPGNPWGNTPPAGITY